MQVSNNKRVKILVAIRYPVGGIRTYIKYTYKKLDRDLFEFDFVAPSKEWLNRIREDLTGFMVKTYYTANENSNYELLFLIYKLIRRKNYKIIHSQGYTAGILSNIANLSHNVPHIITLHHVFGHGQFSDTFWNTFTQLKRQAIQLILSRTDKIQTVSNDAMKNFLQYFPGMERQKKKLITIRNGIDTSEFLSDHEILTRQFEKEYGNIYLGFLGRYMPEKGFPFIIDAIEKINQLL